MDIMSAAMALRTGGQSRSTQRGYATPVDSSQQKEYAFEVSWCAPGVLPSRFRDALPADHWLNSALSLIFPHFLIFRGKSDRAIEGEH